MNYLAHLVLSGPDPDWRLGGLLGDFVKGPLAGERPAGIEAGIQLHRRIDALTDTHPAYLESLPLLGPEWRRFTGIILDIWFDHILSRQWTQWQDEPQADFCQRCWRDFRARSRYIPPRAQLFVQRAEQHQLLENYGDERVIAETLARVGLRLRRPVPLADSLPLLRANAPQLETNFAALFHDLRLEAERFRQSYPIQ